MASIKRKALETQLHRRVRARRDPSEEPEDVLNRRASSTQPHEESRSVHSESDPEDLLENDEGDTSEGDAESEADTEEATSISFGALAKAQATLLGSAKRRGSSKTNGETTESGEKENTWQDNEALERKAGHKDRRDFSRSNKHAPTELSSKKAVSRKREVVPVIKREYRDPRFETLGGRLDESKVEKAYSFLDDYRDDEMKELQNAIKKTKDESEKEGLKRTLLSMESRKKAQDRKRKEAEILDRHRKEEKELVKQGKKPFYLKKAEQQKRLMVDRYSELKGKQLDHVLERRRKKVEGKEKKKMPWARRGAGE